MSLPEFLKWYFRSALGIGTVAAGVVCAAALLGAGVSVAAAVPLGAALVAVAGGISFASGAGPKAVVAMRDAATADKNLDRLKLARVDRERLARMRIPDSDVAAATAAVVLSASEFIDACQEESSYDPIAAEALSESVDIVNAYMKELDASSTDKRYALGDGGALPDLRGRTIAALKERAGALRDGRSKLNGGLTGEELLSVREELK